MAATYSLLSKVLRQSSTNLSRVDWQPMPCLKAPRKGLKQFSKCALSWIFIDFSKSLAVITLQALMLPYSLLLSRYYPILSICASLHCESHEVRSLRGSVGFTCHAAGRGSFLLGVKTWLSIH